jgi:hypothetical protein
VLERREEGLLHDVVDHGVVPEQAVHDARDVTGMSLERTLLSRFDP